MKYGTEIIAFAEMAVRVADRWRRRPTHELGSLSSRPSMCKGCGIRHLNTPSPFCVGCEANGEYTGPIEQQPVDDTCRAERD